MLKHFFALLMLFVLSCKKTTPPPAPKTPAAPAADSAPAPKKDEKKDEKVKPYKDIITADAVTDSGFFISHKVKKTGTLNCLKRSWTKKF